MDGFQAAKEEIKRVADIVELIGQFVQLKAVRPELHGSLPLFTRKKLRPSQSALQAECFHCFGCKKGGDLFAFWMEYHRVSFAQALKDLAEKYHISLPERDPVTTESRTRSSGRMKRQRIFSITFCSNRQRGRPQGLPAAERHPRGNH